MIRKLAGVLTSALVPYNFYKQIYNIFLFNCVDSIAQVLREIIMWVAAYKLTCACHGKALANIMHVQPVYVQITFN